MLICLHIWIAWHTLMSKYKYIILNLVLNIKEILSQTVMCLYINSGFIGIKDYNCWSGVEYDALYAGTFL